MLLMRASALMSAARLLMRAAVGMLAPLALTGMRKIDTTFLISHRMALEDAPKGYKMFHDNQNETTKVVMKPGLAVA